MKYRKTLMALCTALAAASLVGTVGVAQAAEFTLRVGHMNPPTSPEQTRMIEPWCAKVNRESQGRIECEIYPGGQLGGTPAQMFDQAKNGIADIIWTVPTYSAGRFIKSSVFELPWMAHSGEEGSMALWDYTQKYALDEYKGVKLIFMHLHAGTLFHFSGKSQPKTLEDLKGLKIRSANRSNSQMLEALGIAPVQLPLPAVPDALAKGVVDGAAVPWEGVPTMKLDEITRYHLDVPQDEPKMGNTIFAMVMNQAKYDSLPPELRKVIDDNSGVEVSGWAARVGHDIEREDIIKDILKDGGTIHYISEDEYKRWVDATKDVDQKWIADVDKRGGNGQELLTAARAMMVQYNGRKATYSAE